jgi:translation elongation factor EF-G
MKRIKKKDIKKYKEKIEELVDDDGAPIEGDRTPTNDSEIETAPQQTTDDFAKSAIQPNRYYYGFAGTPYSHGSKIRSESEKERAKKLMKDMIENILNKNDYYNDIVKQYKDSDVNKNGIPDLDELNDAFHKPVVVKKTKDLLRSIEMNGLNGEETGIVLNFILKNIDLSEIPQEYKTNLRKLI